MLIHKACSSHTSSGDNLCKLSPFTKYVSFIPLPVRGQCFFQHPPGASLHVTLLYFSARQGAKYDPQGARKEKLMEMLKCHKASLLTADVMCLPSLYVSVFVL